MEKNRSWIVPVGIAIIIVIIAVFYFSMNKENAPVSTAITASTTPQNSMYARYVEPTSDFFEVDYPEGWLVRATAPNDFSLGGMVSAPSATTSAAGPLISLEVDQMPGSPTNFSFKNVENGALSAVATSSATILTSQQEEIAGDQGFYILYKNPTTDVEGVYVAVLAKGTPDLAAKGTSALANAPYILYLQYKAPADLYSQTIADDLVLSLKENVLPAIVNK